MTIEKNKLAWQSRVVSILFLFSIFAGIFTVTYVPNAQAEADVQDIKDIDWSFNGPFGTFDRGALQRGYKVYKEVCASCHSMSLLSFRNLSQPGGTEFSEEQVKAIASEYLITDGPNADGDMFERAGEAKDRFPSPYENDNAAKTSNNGALPPDLSVIVKARKYGANYIYSLLTGYKQAPVGMEVLDGQYYNAAYSDNNAQYPGGVFAMANPLSKDVVEYTDGSPQTVEQYAKDVSHFLTWAAEPTLEKRKRIGFQVMIFLFALAGILFLATKKIWRDVKK